MSGSTITSAVDIPDFLDGLNNSQDFIDAEHKYGAHNYHSIPVVVDSGKRCYMYDVEGKEYFDFLSSYSAVSQGHCHPRIIEALVKQSSKITLTSRAFMNTLLSPYSRYISNYFGYDKLLPMNSGSEGGETAVKICRKWGYMKKKIPNNKAKVIFCNNNFWGRTIAACSSSSNADCYEGFGPFTPGLELIEYNNIKALEEALKDPNVAGFYVEPIQGEGGVIIPEDGYLKKAYDLCKSRNVLFIADEIQTGLCRTGKLLACDHENVRPDILILGKSLSGGVLPVSAVLADNDIMMCIEPGTHGSTFGGNPLACAVATVALQVLKDENLAENAHRLGEQFRTHIKNLNLDFIVEVRGKGSLNAIEIDSSKVNAWELCVALSKNGILTKPSHERNVRFAPALVMTSEEMSIALEKISSVLLSFDKTKNQKN